MASLNLACSFAVLVSPFIAFRFKGRLASSIARSDAWAAASLCCKAISLTAGDLNRDWSKVCGGRPPRSSPICVDRISCLETSGRAERTPYKTFCGPCCSTRCLAVPAVQRVAELCRHPNGDCGTCSKPPVRCVAADSREVGDQTASGSRTATTRHSHQ